MQEEQEKHNPKRSYFHDFFDENREELIKESDTMLVADFNRKYRISSELYNDYL